MGNSSSDHAQKSSQPLDTLTDDALVTLKDRPGSTQAEIFKFLEAKYMTKIPMNRKKSVGIRLKAVMQRPTRGRYQLRSATNKSSAGGNSSRRRSSGCFPPAVRGGRRKSKRRIHKTRHPTSLRDKRLGKKIDGRCKIKRKKRQILQPFLKDAVPGKGPTIRDSYKFKGGLKSMSNHRGMPPSRSKTNQSSGKKTSRNSKLAPYYQSSDDTLKTASRSSYGKAALHHHHPNAKTNRSYLCNNTSGRTIQQTTKSGSRLGMMSRGSAHEPQRPHCKRDRKISEQEESDTENESSSDHHDDYASAHRRTRRRSNNYSDLYSTPQRHRQKYSKLRRRSVEQQLKRQHAVASDSEDDLSSDDDSEC